MHKTVMIASFHVLVSRNILRTPVLQRLTTAGVRIVILVPDHKIEFFKKEFERPGVIIEGVKGYVFSRTFLGLVFKRLSRSLLDTPTTRVRMRQKLVVFHRFFYYYFFHLPAHFVGKSAFALRAVRFLDARLRNHKGYFRGLFDVYRPDLVIATDVNNENDVALMQDAREAGIRYVAINRSWDNLTNFLMRILPERLFVQNDILKRQAVRYQGMKPDDVTVVGIPHYDRYMQGPTVERAEFFKKLGLDQKRKLILYVPISDFRIKDNDLDAYVIGLLAAPGFNVLVRVPPAGTMTLSDFTLPRNVFIDMPGVNFGAKGESELSRADDDQLINSLSYADVVVSGPGTMNIDAAVFDKPLVLVDFYPKPRKPLERIVEYQYEHIQPILQSGGACVAKSPEELMASVSRYLEDSHLDAAGRARIVDEQAYCLDGHASERLAEAIVAELS